MRYTKPSIAALGVASRAIQGNMVKGSIHLDANEHERPFPSTGSAYDLDE